MAFAAASFFASPEDYTRKGKFQKNKQRTRRSALFVLVFIGI